jgi:anti-anti-sigma factor
MTIVLEPPARERYVVVVEGRLQVPITFDVPQAVQALFDRGQRAIVLDLSRVSSIDAAGIGEVVRAYCLMAAGNGRLRIQHANAWVRKTLELVGLFDLLTATVCSDAGAAAERSELPDALTMPRPA